AEEPALAHAEVGGKSPDRQALQPVLGGDVRRSAQDRVPCPLVSWPARHCRSFRARPFGQLWRTVIPSHPSTNVRAEKGGVMSMLRSRWTSGPAVDFAGP